MVQDKAIVTMAD